MTFDECRKFIQGEISFRDWIFHVGGETDKWYMQIQFMAPDNDIQGSFDDTCTYRPHMTLQKCRKWRLSPHMTRTELVRTAFLAVKQAVQHEIEEQFQYKGEAIFNSHLDIDEVWAMSKKHRYDVRAGVAR